LEHGAHLVLHALTKYLNGHGDLLGGAVLGEFALVEKIRRHGLRYITGATLSPMSAYLVLRGLKTLSLRMERHSQTALRIAKMLAGHPAVRHVRYPFLETDASYATAKRQMSGGSGMLSFSLKSGSAGADRFMDRLKLVLRRIEPEARMAGGVADDMMRLSVGLEDAEDLLDDLTQALDTM
jgi:methionine-gamma-lyase